MIDMIEAEHRAKFAKQFSELQQDTQHMIAVHFVDYFIGNYATRKNRYIIFDAALGMEYDFIRKGSTEKRFGPYQIFEMYKYILKGLRAGMAPFHTERQGYSGYSPGMSRIYPQWKGADI